MTATLNALPGMLDLVIYAGDNTKIQFDITSAEQPFTPPGTQAATMRDSYDATIAYSFTLENDPLIDGRVFMTVPTETAELIVGAPLCSKYVGDDLITAPMWSGVWDWQYTDGGDVHTIAAGKVTIIGEVTHA